MPNVPDIIADRTIAYGVDIRRFEQATVDKILRFLKELEQDLVRKVERLSLSGTQARQLERAEKLLEGVQATINRSFRGANGQLVVELRELTEFSLKEGPAILNGALQADIASVSFSRNTIRSIVNENLIQGAPSSEWWAKQAVNTRQRFATQVRLGIAQGETNAEIVRRIRGTATGKKLVTRLPDGTRKVFNEFKGGIMDATTREAEALVRSSVQTVNNEALMETYKQNDDLVRGVQALVTLDGRTTVICISRAGAMWDLKTGKPLSGSPRDERFPGPPPWHWNCRTVLVAITVSWDELLENSKGSRRGKVKKIPNEVRASMGGPVSVPDLTYEAWLKTKPVPFQKRALGPRRWELWQKGKIKGLHQLTDQKGRALTITQLEEGKGLVQRKAG